MKLKRPGVAAVEMTVASAALLFLISTLVPIVESTRLTSQQLFQQGNLKQFGLAMHTYHSSLEPVLDDITVVLMDTADSGLADSDRIERLNRDLSDLTLGYEMLLDAIRHQATVTKDRKELGLLIRAEADIADLVWAIETMQGFLDVLTWPDYLLDRFRDEEELIEFVLRE